MHEEVGLESEKDAWMDGFGKRKGRGNIWEQQIPADLPIFFDYLRMPAAATCLPGGITAMFNITPTKASGDQFGKLLAPFFVLLSV